MDYGAGDDPDQDGNDNEYADGTNPYNGSLLVIRLDVSATGGTVDVEPKKTEYAYGDTVTLTGRPNAGLQFTGWGGDATGLLNPLPLTLYRSLKILTRFETPVALAQALDTPLRQWTTGGDASWFGQSNQNHDGSHAAMTSQAPFGTVSFLETLVEGPGTASFWWRAESSGLDRYQFLIDGTHEPLASSPTDRWGQFAWQKVAVPIGTGIHSLSWIFESQSGGPAGSAYLDQFSFRVSIPANAAYKAWAALQFSPEELANGLLTSPEASFQSDGISNLLKYAFNMDPRVPTGGDRTLQSETGTSGLPLVSLSDTGNERQLSVEYIRRRSVQDLAYIVQFSSTLNDQGQDGWQESTVEFTTPIDGDWERVVVKDTVRVADGRSRYGRVKIVPTPD
ncbi:MAG: hypothetical protein R3F19_12290 [Verrucomicrobiales bacterium]